MKKIAQYLSVLVFLVWSSHGAAQVILSDSFNVTGSGTGFDLDTGINSGINPPTTRLTGTASPNLRYISTGTKTNTSFSITGNKLTVATNANPGRLTFSTDGVAPFNFATVLGSAAATPQKPVVYDISISMANDSEDNLRCSFALGTAEGDAGTWDFGFQLYRIASTARHYVIGKRIDTTASGLAADLNAVITNTVAGTVGTEINFLMRVTDAGSETTSFNSRIQLSMDGGFTFFYDTDSDPDLGNGWRLNGTGRYIMCDIAPNAGPVTYDNLRVVPAPVSARLTAPANNAVNLGAAPLLKTVVSNDLPGNVTVTFFGRQAPKTLPPDFLIPVLPDTQNYAREASGSGNATKEMWFSQTDWIVNNRVAENIAFVATLGDCVQNAGDHQEWRNATNAMYRLENPLPTKLTHGVPYGITVGNHDQSPAGDPDGATTYYNQYFGTAHFDDKPYYGGHYSTNNDSWFDLFSAGGMDFIVLSFEYGRYGDLILDWAEAVLATNRNRRVIVLTHHAGDDNSDVNATHTAHSVQGTAIYDRLKSNTNFFLMLGGHVFNEGGEGRRSDSPSTGRTVWTLISDYQGRFNGGNGLMRLMYFSPSNNLVSVKTFSPHTGLYETDANSQFTFSYNMQPNGPALAGTPFVAIGTNTSVAPGTESTFAWSGLQPNKVYDWYVRVTDAHGNSVVSPQQRFTTGVNAAPVATNQLLTIVGDKPTPLTLTALDSNGDRLTYQTNSQPTNGILTGFDSVGGTVVYLPARGFRGIDRFNYRASDSVAFSSIVRFDLNVIAPPDTNGNSLPDQWESTFGVSDPNADADGDGHSNLQEYLANTNPTNANSLLRIVSANWTNNAFGLGWSSVGGTRYRLQYASPDVMGPYQDIIRLFDAEMDRGPYGSPGTQSYTDNLAITNVPRYYRLKVVP